MPRYFQLERDMQDRCFATEWLALTDRGAGATWRRLLAAEDGAVLVLVTLTLPIILVLGSFVVDLGRVSAEQTELQAFADHVALAAAGELDGEDGAIGRARTAAATFITGDRQTWGEGEPALSAQVDGDVALRFLVDLPADDDAPIGTAYETSADADARFVEVTVTPRTVSHLLAQAASAGLRAIGADGDLPATTLLDAPAVAGFTEYVCDITPLMFCRPNDPALYADLPGRMISLKNGVGWGPGAFGLLDNLAAADGPCGAPNQGANFWRCATALVEGATRCTPRHAGVDIRPGNVAGPTESGLNVRFDIFATSLNSERNNPNFAPAPNVVKGIVAKGGGGGNNQGGGNQGGGNQGGGNQGGGGGGGNACIGNNFDPSPDVMSLPRDTCFATGTCAGGRFGDGIWDEAGYIATNHGGTAPAGYGAGGTRYDMYLAEIDAAGGGDILTGLSQTGRPECSNQMSPDPERRVLVAAAVDCSTLPGGNASGVPVEDYWRIFMTEPAGMPSNGDVWVEVIDRVEPFGAGAAQGILRDVAQLYR